MTDKIIENLFGIIICIAIFRAVIPLLTDMTADITDQIKKLIWRIKQ